MTYLKYGALAVILTLNSLTHGLAKSLPAQEHSASYRNIALLTTLVGPVVHKHIKHTIHLRAQETTQHGNTAIKNILDQATPFVHNELARAGVTDAQKVIVLLGSEISSGVTHGDDKDYFFLGIEDLARLIKLGIVTIEGNALSEPLARLASVETSPEKRTFIFHQLHGIIAHEASHIIHRDTQIGMLQAYVVPLITLIVSQTLSSLIEAKIVPQTSSSEQHKILKVCVETVLSYVLANLSTHLVTSSLSRSHELRADENIPNDPQTVSAMIAYFENSATHEKGIRPWQFWFSEHPDTQLRIKRLKERLALLPKN